MFHEKTASASKGKWRGILMELGIPAEVLKDRHGPCPLCGGTDRFRWDNKDGRGSYICNACGAGDGMRLAIEFTGQAFSQIAPRIDAMLGNIKPESAPPRQGMTDDERAALLRATYAETRPIQPGDAAHAYLETRHLAEMIYPDALRFGPRMRDGEGGVRPCMVAMVGIHGDLRNGRQRYLTMHRTFLRPDGLAKAEMASPRKMMPGAVPDGACVMLSEWTGGGCIGIAEGIETAMGASALHGVPVWAALNAGMMEKWLPPTGADEVVIFADNDANFRGHRAAGVLAHKLATRPEYSGVQIDIQMPPRIGTDWADEWMIRNTTRSHA